MSILQTLTSILGLVFLAFGLFAFLTAVLGLFRFDCALNRMHAAAIGDALGIFCILVGLMFLHRWSLATVKIALIFLFLWTTSPVSSHLLAEMELWTGSRQEFEVEQR